MFWAKCIISIVWNGMKMGNGNRIGNFLYNYIEKFVTALLYNFSVFTE